MRSYTVHRRRRTIGQPRAEAESTVFARDGFAWLAFLAPVLWALYHRMWLVLVVYVGLVVAANMALASSEAPDAIIWILNAAIHFLFAAEARDLWRWTLARRGYDIVAIVLARTLAEAEIAYFRNWHAAILAYQKEHGAREDVEISYRGGPDQPVIGLFADDKTA